MIAHNSSTAPDLSEQQLLSCVAGPGYSSRGCDGGSASEVIDYVYNSNLTVEARCGATSDLLMHLTIQCCPF
jgi:hypothetical protein